ncbi:MAG: VWA domain-containing protein [Candidatus Omnitrophica bacterium]|nr:VWA domain-containing protein [Candidatus Omnitrophota bacterium]
MIFKDVLILAFVPVVVLGALWMRNHKRVNSLKFSSKDLVKDFKPGLRVVCAENLIFLRLLVVVLFLFALARPRLPLEISNLETEGIDIALAIDSSGSMLAEDFNRGSSRSNRLDAVKGVVDDFITMREHDRIGLVAFAAKAYTVCPLTLDYDWLSSNLKRVEIGVIEDGTAIGSAIASSVNRLKNTAAKSKIIILLTDGVNNTGEISPQTAAAAAAALGIKIYTIGVGSEGLVPYPVNDLFGRQAYRNVEIPLDEELLRQIAQKTEGRYYRAVDTESLREIYKEIDSLEKTIIQDKGFMRHKELFSWFLLPALILLLMEVILTNTVLRVLP